MNKRYKTVSFKLLVAFCVARHCAYCIFSCHSPSNILSSIIRDRLRIKFHFLETRLQNINLTTGSKLVRNIIVNFKGACSQHRKERICQTLFLGYLFSPVVNCLCVFCVRQKVAKWGIKCAVAFTNT